MEYAITKLWDLLGPSRRLWKCLSKLPEHSRKFLRKLNRSINWAIGPEEDSLPPALWRGGWVPWGRSSGFPKIFSFRRALPARAVLPAWRLSQDYKWKQEVAVNIKAWYDIIPFLVFWKVWDNKKIEHLCNGKITEHSVCIYPSMTLDDQS